MSQHYDPYAEMKAFYKLDDPTVEQQFRFVEAMKYTIETASFEDDIVAACYNLAVYYRDIREFNLEKKYLEIGAQYDKDICGEELGILWYYGLTGQRDYEKAYRYFSQSSFRRSQYLIADMYHDGNYLPHDPKKCRDIIYELFLAVHSERHDPRFVVSTLFPEIAVRCVRLFMEDGKDSEFDFDCLLDARSILTERQKHRPCWMNLQTMRDILETTVKMVGNDFDFVDLYDLMTYDTDSARVTFDYGGTDHFLDMFRKDGETVCRFENKWYHGSDDFLEKARIGGKRITTVIDLITDIRVQPL